MPPRRRSFFAGAGNGEDATATGFDPAAVMPPERPAMPMSPGTHGGGVGGHVGIGGQAQPESGQGAPMSQGAPPGPPVMSPPMPGSTALTPATAPAFTQPQLGGQGGGGGLPTTMTLKLLRMLHRF